MSQTSADRPNGSSIGETAAAVDGGSRLLLACADPASAEAMAGTLAELGTVEVVTSAAAALDSARSLMPSVMVTDLGPAGLELVRRFRALPESRLVPLVLIGPADERAAALDAEADDYLAAPVSRADLRALAAARLRWARGRQEEMKRAVAAREDAESAARARDEFLSMVSHELRTPLGAILIWAQLVRTERLDEAGLARALAMIERSARTLAHLVDDLVDVSRIVSGKLRLELRPLDLGEVVDAAVRNAESADDGRGVTVETHLEAAARAVAGDRGRLQQVIVALLAAAIKSAPPGGRVAIRVENADGAVRLIVSEQAGDQGAATDSTRRPGLRLTLARRLVEMHGGRLELDPDAFRITLPGLSAVSPLPSPRERAAEPPVPDATALRGLSVLLVDDEEDAREGLRLVLERSGARVRAVDSARAALEALQGERPDVLLSDISMPNEDGYSLIRKVRGMTPEMGGDVPAAAVTAYGGEADRERALGAGYLAHLAKPVEPHALVDLVARLARAAPPRGRASSPSGGDGSEPPDRSSPRSSSPST